MGKCQWQLWDSFYYSCLCLLWNGILITCYNTTFMFPNELHKQLHQQSEQNSNQLYSHLHICQCSSIVLASDYSRSTVKLHSTHTASYLIITFSMQKNLESRYDDGRTSLWFFISSINLLWLLIVCILHLQCLSSILFVHIIIIYKLPYFSISPSFSHRSAIVNSCVKLGFVLKCDQGICKL